MLMYRKFLQDTHQTEEKGGGEGEKWLKRFLSFLYLCIFDGSNVLLPYLYN